MASTAQTFTPPPAIGDTGAWIDWADALPAARELGLRFAAIERGHVVASLSDSPWPLNPNRSVFGGLVLAAADQVMGTAAMTIQEAGGVIATASLSMDFPRPAMLPLALTADVTRAGRTLAFVELTIIDRHERLCGRAIGTWSINLELP
jgi:uncharacterized protein (TIGR00369 family)